MSIHSENLKSSGHGLRQESRRSVRIDLYQLFHPSRTAHDLEGLRAQGEVPMSGQVVLYFEDQADALRFALAAGSVMAGEGAKFTSDLVQETARVTRIRLDAVNAVGGSSKKTSPIRVA